MKMKVLLATMLALTIVTAGTARWLQSAPEAASAAASEGAISNRISLEDLPRAPETPLLNQPLAIGMQAPDFALPDQKGKVQRLSELKGKYVVLAFYPQDITYSCAGQLTSLQSSLPELSSMDAVVFGVSIQPIFSKVIFADSFGLTYPLLSDNGGTVARKYGVMTQSGLAGRVAFIIGPDRKILLTDHVTDVRNFGTDMAGALSLLQPQTVTLFQDPLRILYQ